MTETFNPGELFIYRKAPGVYELGVVKCQRDDRTYYCYYSTGDTAAATPVVKMRKLVNAHWAQIVWAKLWESKSRCEIRVDDVLGLMPRAHQVLISDGIGEMIYYFEGRVEAVPDELKELRVKGITAYDGCVDIEACDG